MHQQTASEDQADMEPDIFDMAKPSSPEASANNGAERATPGQNDGADTRAPRIKRLGDKLRPRHAVAAAVAATAVWIGWPYLFSGGHPAPAQSARLLIPGPAQAGATPTAPRAPLQAGAAGPLAPPERQGPDQSPATTAAQEPAPEPTARDVALQASIDQLREKLATVESLLARQAAAKGAPARPAHPRAKPKIAAHAPPRKLAAPLKTVPATTFSLNTVFRNQAWLRGPDLTYVVQPGDVINGLEVIRIDPVARTVLTSQGIIR